MKILSQRDPAWAADKLGASTLTIGRFGCTTTCISMLSDYFGCYKSPLEIAHNASNYTPDGLVVWSRLMFARMQFVRRDRTFDAAAIADSIKDPNKAVMLEVNNGQHWVVAIRKTLFGNDYFVADPWTGKKVGAKAAYHNITGAAYFKRA